MDDWVLRAMARWPNVPALFGWLGLDRRGRWLIKNEIISHPRIIETIDRNYAHDEHGRWFFQNGPQRGYIALASAPLVLRAAPDDPDALVTHTNRRVTQPGAAYLDEEGALVLTTEHGPGEIVGSELDWALHRLRRDGRPIAESDLMSALETVSGQMTRMTLLLSDAELPVGRLDFAAAPDKLGFVRDPVARPGERAATGAPD